MALDAMSEVAPDTFNDWDEDSGTQKPEPSMRLVEDPAQGSEYELEVARPKSASQIAADAIKNLRFKPGQYVPPETTAFERQKARAEAEDAKRIKNNVNTEFGAHIENALEILNRKEEAAQLSERRYSIKNTKLLKVLLEHGYIDETMLEEGSVDTAGFIAARLLVSKEFTNHQKYLLVGGHKKLAREFIMDEITKFDSMPKNKSSGY
jgi:hypothetical protein